MIFMQNEKKFEQLINKEKYQVFLFISRGSLPLSFAVHPWFVINKKGVLSRWEVTHLKRRGEKSWGHLSLNFFPFFLGTTILPIYSKAFYSKGNFSTKLIGSVTSDESGLAGKMVDFIENSPNTYPYLNAYHFVGPNSNTFVQWILNNFPDFKAKLPWNAFGKKHRVL